MGNYRNPETDFVKRTLELISQYEVLMHDKFAFEYHYNHTLLINCLLGLIVFPKERNYTLLPDHRFTADIREDLGIKQSTFNGSITTLKELITALRHSIAHFDITFESETSDFLIDRIVFNNGDDNGYIASFAPDELLGFIRYYASWFLKNYEEHRDKFK